MIFNPYQLDTFTTEAAATASRLTAAVPLLQNSAPIVTLVLTFIAADVLAWCPKGVMRHQLQWITDTRNARTFESSVVIYPWLKGVLILQLFLSFGLTLFGAIDPEAGAHFTHMDASSGLQLTLCMSVFLGWYLLQMGFFNWGCYLFGLEDKCTIMSRTYQASFIVLAPLSTICLVALIAGLISSQTTLNLLAALFILSQITFIFSGFKIFYDGFGSICLIIVYLCALEIAPLAILWARFSSY